MSDPAHYMSHPSSEKSHSPPLCSRNSFLSFRKSSIRLLNSIEITNSQSSLRSISNMLRRASTLLSMNQIAGSNSHVSYSAM
jgi:hypothetical protein